MMLKYLIVFTCAIAFVSGQAWVSSARLKDGVNFWFNVLQEMFYEVEKRGWSNLKLDDITQNVDLTLFNFHVNGTARYTNGFVVSIQKIDLASMRTDVVSQTVNGVATPFGFATGIINFRDMLIGHDVEADLQIPEEQYRGTGTFLHTLVQVQLSLNRNLITKESTIAVSVPIASAGSGVRMQYLPRSNITEALSRPFSTSTSASARNWGTNIFGPIILDVIDTKVPFPSVCFNNC